MPYGLSNKTISRLQEVFTHYGQIDEVILYGSRAKGNYSEGSDIDLTLTGQNLDSSCLQKIRTDIDNLLLPYLVDISILNTIKNKDLTDHIQRMGKTIYKAT